MSQNIPDFLNSRNEKIFLELPDYSFCHSSQTDEKTNSFFLGRDLLKSRLKNIIVSKSSKTGVYLVTGNRGVGKSCLVEEVIGKTSLRKININSYFNFLLLSFFLLLGLQYVNGISVVRNFVERWWFIAILSLVSIIIFTITGYISYLRHAKKQYAHDKKFLINLSAFWRTLLAAGQDFLRLPNKRNPFLRVQNVLKMILILLLIQIFSIFTPFSHFKLFVVYSCIIAGCHYFRYTKQTLINKFRNNYESNLDELEEKTLCERLINQKFPDWIWSIFVVFFSSMIPILLISRFDETSTVKNIASSAFFIIILVSTFLIFFIPFLRNRILIGDAIEKKDGSWLENWWKKTVITLKYSGLHFGKIVNYLENCNRVFLKINFGHDVLKERDILRLITRTLTTEYNVFCKSLKHRFYWHLLAIGVIFFITSIFYNNIYKNDIRPLIEHSSLYKTSSQLYYASDTNAKENKYLRKILVCNGNIHLYTTLKDTIKKYAINDQEKENGIRNLDIKIKKETKKRDNLRAEFFDKYLNNQANNNIEYLIYVDRAVNRAWFYLQNLPIFFWEKGYATKDTDIETINRRKENFNHAPVNYAWLLFFLSFYLLGYLILKSRLFTTHYTIKRQLRLLNESITYSIEQEVSARYYPESKFEVGLKKKKSRIIADEREIEKELQDILNNIRKIPSFMSRPSFVIVFDELDKVTPEGQKLSIDENNEKHKEAMFSSDSTSERQAVILKLLSNMKYFLSTANAKFIFIAGREMYDMYLADIADRNNYFGSIFNDVIFVPSFLTDTTPFRRKNDITTLVEEYVCRHLIPANYPNVEWTLKEYEKYLRKEIYSEAKIEYKKQINRKIQKIIATLQQFIIYLSHTSKGAPKKMIQVFESFIETYKPYYIKEKHFVVKQLRNTQFFLAFDYYDQYSIGMTSYVVSPVIYHLTNSNIQAHSDKLLVSILHFVDYMLKFHNQNFSRRNLEISQEIIEINRSPELKTIVNGVINLFEQIHIRKPIISFYEFKFNTVLAQDIFFISKMDERFSAQFNFSLDESLALKQFYKKLLREKQTEYKELKGSGRDFVSSIASLQFLLGDLHFLDDELDKAAIYYKDSVHLLREKLTLDEDHQNHELFYLFIRNQLKLAYLYEKRKQPEFAYLLFGEMVKLLIEVRDLDLEDMGITFRKDNIDDEKFIMIKLRRNTTNNPNDNYNKYVETPKCNICDTTVQDIKGNDVTVRDMASLQLTPKIQQILFKNMTFEGLQLIFLPLLAKLQILEKRYSAGILKRDVDLIEKEFKFLIRTIKHTDIKILTADFFSKIGDILYYKNNVWDNQNNVGKYNIHISNNAYNYYKKALIGLLINEEEYRKHETMSILEILKDNVQLIENETSAKYCNVMARVLSNLGDVYFQLNPKQCQECKLPEKIKCDFGNFKGEDKNIIRKVEPFWEFWWKLFTDKINLANFLDNIIQLDNIGHAIFYYSLSMKFYERANQHKQSTFQITKILNCFKYSLKERSSIKCFLNRIDNGENEGCFKSIARNAICSMYLAYNNLNIFEINKRKEDLDVFKKPSAERKIPLHYIQVDSEISRICTIVKALELNLSYNKVGTIQEIYSQHITSPYHINYSISARIYRLKLKTTLNWEAYKIMKDDAECMYDMDNIYDDILKILTLKNKWEKSNSKEIFKTIDFKDNTQNHFFEVFEMLIADSIFCFVEILRLIKTSGDSYLLNHGFFAKIYRNLSEWTNMYEALISLIDYCDTDKINKNNKKLEEALSTHALTDENKKSLSKILSKKEIDNYLEKFLGKDYREQLSSHYYRQQALSHYYQSIETHNGGRAYLNMVDKMYFIKGDYDDAAGHFNVAVERFRINNSNYESKIKELEEKSKLSTLFDVSNYFEKQN